MALKITITDAGRAEVINATNTGTAPVEITQVGLGSGQYLPNPTQTALVSEIKRVSTIAGNIVNPDTIHVTVKDETEDNYDVSEFGLYTASGTLFAVYSEVGGPFIQKTAQSTLLLAVDIILGTLDATSLTFGDTSFANPPASSTVFGVVRLMESQQDTSETNALTRGAWGLGKILPIADADLATESGFYSMPVFLGAANSPMTGQSGSLLVVKGGADTNYISQIWTHSNDTDSNRQFIRHKKGAGPWSPWDEMATQAFVNSRVGNAVAGSKNVSEIDGNGVLEITPADGKYVTLQGTGTGNHTITGFGDQCPIGYELSLHIPRVNANTGQPTNMLGWFVQFVHTAEGDGLDMSLNARQSGLSTLYTYQAYPNATDNFGNLCALHETLKFFYAGSGRWKLIAMPESFYSQISPVEGINRTASGKQDIFAQKTSLSNVTTLIGGGIYGTLNNNWEFPAQFTDRATTTVTEITGVGGCWGVRSSTGAPSNTAFQWQLFRFDATGNTPTASLTATGRWKPNV